MFYSRGSYGKPVDIWAIGCILGELTDGQVRNTTEESNCSIVLFSIIHLVVVLLNVLALTVVAKYIVALTTFVVAQEAKMFPDKFQNIQ